MNTEDTSKYVRLRVELVLEIDDAEAVTAAALQRIAEDAEMPESERTHSESTVTEDTAEALAYLVDPFDLIGEVPGVELHQASWSSEPVAYDPDAPAWELDDFDADLDADLDGDSGGDSGDGEESGRTGGIG